jgi:hypothetical protein
MELNYNALPHHIAGGVRRYIESGEDVGGFLRAVICNDLRQAFGRADSTNRARMYDIVQFFWHEAPAPCWGSPQSLERWQQHQGMQGWDKE